MKLDQVNKTVGYATGPTGASLQGITVRDIFGTETNYPTADDVMIDNDHMLRIIEAGTKKVIAGYRDNQWVKWHKEPQ